MMISTKHTIYQARLIRSYLDKEIDQKTYYSRYNIDLEIEAYSRSMFGGCFEDVFVEECRRLGLPSTASRRQLPGIAAASLAAEDGKQLKRSSPKDTSPIPEKKQKMESSPSLSPKELKKDLKEPSCEETPNAHDDENGKTQEKVKPEKKRKSYEKERHQALKKQEMAQALPPRELKRLISGSEKRDEIRNSLRELKSGEKKKGEDSSTLTTPPKPQEKKKDATPSPALSEEKITPPPQQATREHIVSTPKVPKKEAFALLRHEMKKSVAPVSPPPQASTEASSPIVTTPKMQRNREFALRRQGTVKKAKTPSRLSLVPKPQGPQSPIRQTSSLLASEDTEQEESPSPFLQEPTNKKRVSLKRYLEMKKKKKNEIPIPPQESKKEDSLPLEDTSSPALDDMKEESPSPQSQEIIEPELASDASEEEILPLDEPVEAACPDRVESIEQEIIPSQSKETPLDSVETIEEEPAISASEIQENENPFSSPSQIPTESAEECNIYLSDAKDMDTPTPVLVESVKQEHSISPPNQPDGIPPLAEPHPEMCSPILQKKPDSAPVPESVAEEIIPAKEKIHDPLARACAICLCKAPRERVFYTDCGHVSCRACAELILFETGFAAASIRNPQIACPFCRKTSGIALLNEDHTFPEDMEEMSAKSSRDQYVEVAIREQRIQRFLNGKVSQKQYVESYNKWMKITVDRHEKKGGHADEIYDTELKRIQAILPHVKDNANLALSAAEVTWLDEKERLISKLKRENDAFSKLKFTDPHRSQYSYACTNCQEAEPRKKCAFISCGHVICQECTERKRKISCNKCRKPSKAVRIFEHEIRPRRQNLLY